MENSQPTITVLMSVYNEQAVFLKKSIDSIINQSFSDFEFLIIDDGSTNQECIMVLKEYKAKDKRINLIKNEKNSGLTKSLNKGLRVSKGKYIARIDSDDMADTHRLKKQLYFMEKNPEYALCGSWAHIINEDDKIIGEKKFHTSYEKIKKNLLYFNFFTHSSLFFKKDIALENGGYNDKIKKAQDYDLILKISGKYPVANIPEFLCFHRTHSESISSKGKKKQEWFAIISRLRAIFIYRYPKTYFWKILPSFFYFLFIPHSIEELIFKLIWKK